MLTRDKIIRKVASELNISIKAVELVVRMQCRLARKTMKNKEHKSVYLRGIGTLIPRSVGKEIAQKKREFYKEKKENSNQDEDPIEFN